jgi:hypothetical protein
MAGVIGAMTAAARYGETNPALSIELGELTEATHAPVYYDPARPASALTTTYRMPDGQGFGRIGRAPGGFGADFYNRLYVAPPRLDLGSVANAQVRQVVVWNAYLDTSATLESTSLIDGDGIDVAAPGALPLTFAPMQERTWTITVSDQGSPSVDATLSFVFTDLDGLSVRIVGTRINAWVVAADWAQPVDETLAWMTDLQRALNGATTRIPCRAAPRRTLEFGLVEGRAERRIIESLIYDWGTRIWALPIWPDVSLLTAPLAQGSDRVALATAGLDFAVGSLAMLWADARTYELLEVDEIAADELVFARGTSRAWPKGARLYPCRTARMTDAPAIRRRSDQVISARVRFEIDEPCDWPAIAPTTTYLGHPVFDTRSDQGDDPSATYSRITVNIDGDVGLVAVDDFSGLVFGRQSHAWKLYGRAERAAHRSLLYWFEGRARAVWLPTWADDVELVEPMTEISEVMVVAWAGISRSLRQQAGRRHLRIELVSGEVFHRRVENSAELDDDREQLLLDVSLGRAVQPAEVRLVCWMALSLLDSDRIEISHVADSQGLATARTTFIADPGNEP